MPRGPRDSGERVPGTEWLPRHVLHTQQLWKRPSARRRPSHLPRRAQLNGAELCHVTKAHLTEGKASITRENMVRTVLRGSE